MIADGLADLAHDVVHVATGGAAIRAVTDGQYDVAVVDRLLPGIDAVAVLRQWRAAAFSYRR